jgi:Bacterial regulatory proteins, luxR family
VEHASQPQASGVHGRFFFVVACSGGWEKELGTVLMVKSGMHSKDIASRLQIACETVKTQRCNIRKKLGMTGTCPRVRA